MYKSDLEKINFLWNKNIKQEELDNLLSKYPNLMSSYSLQERLFK